MIGLMLQLIIIITGACFLGGCNRKQPAVPTPTVVEEKKEDPASRIAAAEKIAGYARPEALISVYELNQLYFNPSTFIFDTRGRSFKVFQTSYPYGHIPGAVPILHGQYSHPEYFDRIAPPQLLAQILGGYGVSNDSTIILYGNDGLQARLYWALRMYGYERVKILDGGLEKWQGEKYDITTAATVRPPDEFEFDLTKLKTDRMLATNSEVKTAIGNKNYVIVDARNRDEFLYGRIPGSVNLSYMELLNDDHTFKTFSDLKTLAEGKSITPDKKVIVYSNSGVRSSMVWFVLSELLGYPSVMNYDGSFNEWLTLGSPVIKGE